MRKKMMTRGALAAALAAAALAAGCKPVQAATGPTPAQYQAGFAAAIATDVAASVTLPNGDDLWLGGDVTRVGTTNVEGYYGYPHGAFMETSPGSATFTVVPGHYGTSYWGYNNNVPGHQYQQVPNWTNADGTQDFFWAQVPIVDGTGGVAGNGTLHVIGERIHATSSSFTVVSTWDAKFSSSTLAFESIYQVPSGSGDAWTGAVLGTRSGVAGWWLTSQHGEVAFVPRGDLARSGTWLVTAGAAPASAGSWPVAAGSGYDLLDAQYGGTEIEKWTASTPAGPWSGPANDGTLPQPQTDGGIEAHPELYAPAGQVLISWDVNVPGGTYDPEFSYAAK